MSTKTFAAGMILVGAILAAAIFTASTVITILGCIGGLGFAVVVGATVFAGPSTPAPAPIASETPSQPSGDAFLALLDELHPEPAVPAPLRLVDADTGELVGDRVLRLEERADGFDRRLGELGDVVAEQNELLTRALGTLRREVERIGHVFPEPADAN